MLRRRESSEPRFRTYKVGFCCAWLVAGTALLACGDDDASVPAGDGGPDAAGEAGSGGNGASPDAGGSGGTGGSGGSGSRDAGGDAGTDGSAEPSTCGNGVIEGDEDCDDGGEADGDGCSASCTSESGWICTTDEPTLCEPYCGDGRLVGAELEADGCDDGDASSDGCDSSCRVESGYACSGEPSVCTPLCGNGAIDDGEACDDGNENADDGCAACARETHWTCSGEPSSCVADLDANVLLGGSQLAAFATRDPAAIRAPIALTGIVAGDTMVAIDRRPLNGMLYGLGFNSTNGTVQLYLISEGSGLCTAIGAVVAAVTGTQFGIDFNPTVDRLRVVDNAGQNLRFNPNNGTLSAADTAINGATATLHECAYTNNSINQTVTTLFTLDQTTDALYIQNPANGGVQTVPVPLSPVVDFVRGFDIPAGVDVTASNLGTDGSGAAIIRLAGESQDSFARLNLGTGALTRITAFITDAVSLALQNIDATPMIGLSADGTQLLRFSSATPGTATTSAITGVGAGEVLVGIDFRPTTGQLYALGVNAAADTASLYMLDPSSGGAAVVGSPGSIALVTAAAAAVDLPPTATGYGFDFNPTVDRIRVVAGNGVNFRVNPITGAAIDADPGVAGVNPDGDVSGLMIGSTGLSGAAYTNNYAQTASPVTTLYVLDPVAHGLYILNPPNNGSATDFVQITAGGSALDFTAVGGFDISDARVTVSNAAVTEGVGYAALTVGGIAHLYAIDLASGAASDLGQIGAGPSLAGLAVGHSHVQ